MSSQENILLISETPVDMNVLQGQVGSERFSLVSIFSGRWNYHSAVLNNCGRIQIS